MSDEVAEWSTLGYFGRLNYNFQGKYLLEFNVRRAAASRFAEESRWGTFGGVSAGWNILNESFLTINESFMDTWKLRVSYGVTGNANVDKFIQPVRYRVVFVAIILMGKEYPSCLLLNW